MSPDPAQDYLLAGFERASDTFAQREAAQRALFDAFVAFFGSPAAYIGTDSEQEALRLAFGYLAARVALLDARDA